MCLGQGKLRGGTEWGGSPTWPAWGRYLLCRSRALRAWSRLAA